MSTSDYSFVEAGTSYAGTPRWQVQLPDGTDIGWVSSLRGKRGTSWSAVRPGRVHSQGGFRDRETAARWLDRTRAVGDDDCSHEFITVLNPLHGWAQDEQYVCDDCTRLLYRDDCGLQEVGT